MPALPGSHRPVSPIIPVLLIMIVFAILVGLIAGQFPFDPVGRQITLIGSSFTLTAGCVAYVIQTARCTAWDELHYQAVLHQLDTGVQDTLPD